MSRRLAAAALGALTLGTLAFTGSAQAGDVSGSSITLQQTVMIDNGNDECANTTVITAPAGTTVRFCYTVTNTGSTTLDLHTVTGSFDGMVLTNFPYNLPPSTSAYITSTEVVNLTTTNTGTWIATNGNNDMAQAQAAATVNVPGTQHTGSVTAVVSAASGCTLDITVTVADEGDDGAYFTVMNTGRPSGVGFSDVASYIGYNEGTFAFTNFDAALGTSLNGTYTFQVTKFGGNGTFLILNPITVLTDVNDLPDCGQHSAAVSITASSACDLDLNVAVDAGTDSEATFTVQNTGRPADVGPSVVLTYIGFTEGGFAFDDFDVAPGGSLNGTYTFVVDKTAGAAMTGINDPVEVEYVVSGLPTCGARIIIEKTTIGGSGGPFQFAVLDSEDNAVANPGGSTSAAGTPTEIYDAYLPAGFYSVQELFDVGDASDPATWDAGDGFFPGTMTCTLTGAGEEQGSSNEAMPTSGGVTGIGYQVADGQVMHCVVENTAPASISITKNTPGEEASPVFTFTGDLATTMSGGSTVTFDGLAPGTYTITEAQLAGWTLTSIGCEGGDATVDLATRTLTVEVGPGESAACEFINFENEAPPTTDDNGSGGGSPTTTAAPTTTRPRTLPDTGGGSGSGTLALLAIGFVFAGTTLLFARRRLPGS